MLTNIADEKFNKTNSLINSRQELFPGKTSGKGTPDIFGNKRVKSVRKTRAGK